MHFNFIKWLSHWWIRRDHGDGDDGDGDVDVSDFADLATGCWVRLEEAASSQTLYGSPSVTLTPLKRQCKVQTSPFFFVSRGCSSGEGSSFHPIR